MVRDKSQTERTAAGAIEKMNQMAKKTTLGKSNTRKSKVKEPEAVVLPVEDVLSPS